MRFSTLSYLISSALAVLATPLPESLLETYDPLNVRNLTDSDRIAALTARISPITTTNTISSASSNDGISPASVDDGISLAGLFSDTECHSTGAMVRREYAEKAKDWYCSYAEGIVVERGYELILPYEAPDFNKPELLNIMVGYRNTKGGSWLIRKDECLDWLWDVVVDCQEFMPLGGERGFWFTWGGWYETTSGEVVLDPNSK